MVKSYVEHEFYISGTGRYYSWRNGRLMNKAYRYEKQGLVTVKRIDRRLGCYTRDGGSIIETFKIEPTRKGLEFFKFS